MTLQPERPHRNFSGFENWGAIQIQNQLNFTVFKRAAWRFIVSSIRPGVAYVLEVSLDDRIQL